MAAVIISWAYIAVVCFLLGMGILGLLGFADPMGAYPAACGRVSADGRKIAAGQAQPGIIYYLTAGIIAVTVYTEIFSIFGKIGALAHIILLFGALLAAVSGRKALYALWSGYKSKIFSWESFFYLCFILFIAFFASRGTFHTDTNIYHAQMIRLYEEYGLIRGMGNLQLHFGYNSSYLAFASIFSLHWLFGQSLHTTTGFVEVIMCVYAFHGLKDFKSRRSHMADMMRVGILFYTLVILTGSMSPATDYTTMYFVLFVIAAWCENAEGSRDIKVYSLLAVAAVFAATLKFSACVLVLIAIYPAVFLVKERRFKEIGCCLGCGLLVMVPFLVRNFLISGWLLYPFNGIDLFSVEWKVPEEYLLVDADQIKVWGRCLYDVKKIHWPISKWLPVWWEGQERYEQMLLGAALLGSFLLFVQLVRRLIKREKLRWDIAALIAAVYACLGVWFFMAPFIRYGLAFLLALPMLATGLYLSEEKKGFYSILTGGLVFCIVVSVSPYWDHYITDAGVFIKHNLDEPYYLFQKDYDRTETGVEEINGNPVYYPLAGEVNSYHVFPGTCYKIMLDRTTLMGEDIRDGFKAR